MKKLSIALCLGVLIAISVLSTVRTTEETLANGVIRLHIRANSDSPEDQSLKLKVRDRILKEAGHLFENTASTEEARIAASGNLEQIKTIAEDEIRRNGYDYPVNIRLGKSDFPMKVYNDLSLPAGTYEALVVEIGSGEGQNWWCVMFPPLCFVDEACTELSPESEEILINNLGDDTYSMLSGGKPVIKFKVYEMIKNWSF